MRLFLGIDVGEDARRALAKALEEVRPLAPSAKWVPAANLHATLVFLGWVDDARVPEVKAAVDTVTSRHRPMAFRLAGGGSFGSKKRPRVLFAGMEGEVEPLAAVHAELEEAMKAFGYEPEKRDYHPHVTLARARDPRGDAALAACVAPLAALEPVAIPLGEVVLYKSTLSRAGPTYEALQRARLGAP